MPRRNDENNTVPYTQLSSLMVRNDTNPTKLAKIIGMSSSSFSGWKKIGRAPKHVFYAALGAMPNKADKILVARLNKDADIIKAFLDFNGVAHITFDTDDF